MVDSTSPIERAIGLAGSEAKLAAGTGFSQVAINKAKRKGRASDRMALAIHRYTNGQVSASEIRPDLWARPEDVPTQPLQTAVAPEAERQP